MDELKTTLKSKLNLEGDVVIQLQNPESKINFLPDIPEGRSPDSLESGRIALMDKMKKKKKDGKMADGLMESTFALRKKEIVDGEPHVSEIHDRWSALFSERQVIICLIYY